MKTCAYLLISLLLSACQANNPYQAAGTPYPPAPAGAAEHFDRSAYPPAARDYGLYRSWAWYNEQPPAGSSWASSQLFNEAVSAGLDQSGLRPAQSPAPADLLVSAQLNIAEVEIIQPDNGGAYYGNGPYGDGYGMWGSAPLDRRYKQEMMRVQISFYDAKSKTLIWQGNAEMASGEDSAERAQNLRQTIRQALADYPPQ